jgi:hypothetical protein
MSGLKINDHDAIRTCLELIQGGDFCCAGAKAALAGQKIAFVVGHDLRDSTHDIHIVKALQKFHSAEPENYNSLAVIFRDTPALLEPEFETFLWYRLQALHELDHQSFSWDPTVSQDPASPRFGFSIGGQAFFVVGMHPAASRISRRMPFPVLAFNPHVQFRRLRANGNYWRVQKATRDRDIALQGYPNPMLADYGTQSEARQYSGRQLPEQWICPFQPVRQEVKSA